VAFAIGTETLGSIVSPSTRCGVTGLRPTYGVVSKYGTMALSWTMDKIGPICRNAIDCAIVLDHIRGSDSRDPSSIEAGMEYPGKVDLPDNIPVSALRVILSSEAAASFNDLTLSGKDSILVSQENWSWPNSFRTSRLIPAVEYIQANRIRTLLINEMYSLMEDFDLILCPTFGGNLLTLTNLTGNPSLLLPDGFDEDSNPTSITIIGPLFSEGLLCAVGELYQGNAEHHNERPPVFNKE
jgi:Asp-tRNA(Asn)/Glu-tRNA(Gln) amidotransferase A subunit family amidase